MTTLLTVSDDRFGRKGGLYKATQEKIRTIFKNNSWLGIDDLRMWDWDSIINTDFYKNTFVPSIDVVTDVLHPTTNNIIVGAGTHFPSVRMLDECDPAKNGRLYKPLAIRDTLRELNDGDFLIYTDCSPEMWYMDANYAIDPRAYHLSVLQNLCMLNDGILTLHVKWNFNTHVQKGEVGYHTHENFTTDSCIAKMGMEAYKYSLQHASGLIVLQKSRRSVDFVDEWLYWNSIPECGGLGGPDDPALWYREVVLNGKIGHRHDQSVSGLLINKMGNKLLETLDWYERPTGSTPYNFIFYCDKRLRYNFFDSNQPMGNICHRMVSADGNFDAPWTITVSDR